MDTLAPFIGDALVKIAADAGLPGRNTPRKRKVKIPRLRKWEVVMVEWLDAVLHEGGQRSSNVFPCAIRRSIGHFIQRSPEAITIAMEDDSQDAEDASDCDNVTTIPLGMVRSITKYIPAL